MAEKYKYVAVVVIETSEKVTKKAVKAFLLRSLGMGYDYSVPSEALAAIDVAVDAVRVRSVDLD